MTNSRRRLTGLVTSDKMDKTIVVEITRRYRHPRYSKVVTSNKRFKVHDEHESKIGDQVRIVESKPISKTKRWVVEEIIKRSKRAEDMAED